MFEKGGEGATVVVEEDEPEKSGDQGERQACVQQEDVEAEDVDEDRTQNGEGKGNVAVEEQKDAANELDVEDDNGVVGLSERGDVLECWSWRHGRLG